MVKTMTRSSALKIQSGRVNIDHYLSRTPRGSKYGFIISQGTKERNNYEVLAESGPDFDESAEARSRGGDLVREVKKNSFNLGEI